MATYDAKPTYQLMQDTFQSFTGADITAIITYKNAGGQYKQKVVGTLSSITVSAVREVNPLWGMGKADFMSVSRGKRSVSGTMTFTVFDRDPLVRDLVSDAQHELGILQNQYSQMNFNIDNVGAGNGQFQSQASGENGFSLQQTIGGIQALYNLLGEQRLRYADQMAPFDITISLINDQRAASVASVRQIYIVSQGTGWSMHDLESDQVYSYIARYYEPLQSITDSIGSVSSDFGTLS